MRERIKLLFYLRHVIIIIVKRVRSMARLPIAFPCRPPKHNDDVEGVMLSIGLELGSVATADCGDGLGRRNTSSRTITC
jgi:hypothetical protein